MPRKDRTFSDRDLIRVFTRHLTALEQGRVRSYFAGDVRPDGDDDDAEARGLCGLLSKSLSDVIAIVGLLVDVVLLLRSRVTGLTRLAHKILTALASVPLIGKTFAPLLAAIQRVNDTLDGLRGRLETLRQSLRALAALADQLCDSL